MVSRASDIKHKWQTAVLTSTVLFKGVITFKSRKSKAALIVLCFIDSFHHLSLLSKCSKAKQNENLIDGQGKDVRDVKEDTSVAMK